MSSLGILLNTIQDWKGWKISFIVVVLCLLSGVNCQSCGPRVSARLLNDIPCDMTNGYCTTPGSAYPWQSVKRYIFENQGLVRRMYGDERHNTVISKEMREHHLRYDPYYLEMGGIVRYGRGRFVRGKPKSRRRQSRPQILTDEPLTTPSTTTTDEPVTTAVDTEETIFRIVTETSVEIGTISTTAATSTTPESSVSPMEAGIVDDNTTEPMSTHAIDDSSPPTFEQTHAALYANAYANPDLEPLPPLALERVDNDGDYDYDTSKSKVSSSFSHNSVEEKVKSKDYEEINNRNDATNNRDIVSTSAKDESSEDDDKVEEEDSQEEPVPRRGINACPVKNEVIAPYWANNTRGDMLALLNVYPFEQYVHFEKCAFENHQMLCREGCRCEQQYRLHRLLAFDPKNECRGIFSDWFRFPSCCVCICYDLTPDRPITRSRTSRL